MEIGVEISEIRFMGVITGVGSVNPLSHPKNPLFLMPEYHTSPVVTKAQASVTDRSPVVDRKICVVPISVPQTEERNSAPNTLMPATSDECINCKSCAKRCPNGVISVENPKLRVKDASACLRYHRCVVYCPKHAISFVGEGYDKMVAGRIARFGKPDKENLYFM